jgi:hypothetical protein
VRSGSLARTNLRHQHLRHFHDGRLVFRHGKHDPGPVANAGHCLRLRFVGLSRLQKCFEVLFGIRGRPEAHLATKGIVADGAAFSDGGHLRRLVIGRTAARDVLDCLAGYVSYSCLSLRPKPRHIPHVYDFAPAPLTASRAARSSSSVLAVCATRVMPALQSPS